MENTFLDGKILVKTGDITEEMSDAIVNAANSTLLGGGGVDGALHRKGGDAILEECRQIRHFDLPKGLPTGEAVITTGGDLPAKFVIHTVGPIYKMNLGRDAELLAACYKNSLKLALENGVKTISFPSISTGAFHYPKRLAAEVSSEAIRDFMENNDEIEQIRLVFFSESDAKLFIKHQRFEQP